MIREAAFRTKLLAAGRDSVSAYRDFLRADRLPPDELEGIGRRRVSELAQFAFAQSPFYRTLYGDHGFTADDLADPASFESLPFVTKSDLREHFESIRTPEATRRTSAVSRTGGSTGLPVHLLRDLRFPSRALEWRLFHWWGVDPWEDRAIVTRHILTGKTRVKHDLAWLPSRRIQLDAYRITDETVRSFAHQWNRVRPPFLLGYGGGVLDFARRAARLGLTLEPPRAIAVTAAPLTAGTRHEIESLLGAPCYDHYRSAEVPWLAGECQAQAGMHVFADVRRVEILDDDDRPVPAGQEGHVVATDLTNRVFPIIRYRLGDISSLMTGSCACGRTLPRLGAISGRNSDALRLPDGTTIAGAMGHIFDDHPLSVARFEIEQAADYAITLRCIPGSGPDADRGIAHAESILRRATKDLVPVTVERVDHIDQVGGKMRFIRSAVNVDPS
ncbi:phenylacetate--CoA ligase family protein [Aeromicrobium sp. zg-636]|uniref:Phenylacetate--CoA ligase family protein n=1 Tax=Aeromicrobium senzhongii TaxID=2663859 RepID=A0A8I0K226_9ACTN|nr:MULTISPECIES: phenylacetate--CoA ligase family protein [Aeromicrobium]MBC9227708.1 phenylacetate--CoA ligase family protein [Aeromicrobium senzhongii]